MKLKLFAAITVFSLLAAGSTPARAIDAAKLRDAANLPHMQVQLKMQFNYDRLDGFVVNPSKPPPAQEIARLRRAIDDSSADAERYLRLALLEALSDAS